MSLTPEQMEIRRTRIGGSDIGALLGINPYKTSLGVFASKVLPPSPEKPAIHLEWGHDVERAILASHARNSDLKIEEPGTLIHPKHPAICATPDGIGVRKSGTRVVIEAKNSQWHQAHRWGEAGTDDAPLLYLAQVQMELGIALALGEVEDVGELVASIAGAPPVIYRIRFDPELFGQLVDVAEKFLRDHVVTGIPPNNWALDRGAGEYLARKFERNDGTVLAATDDLRSLAQSVATMRATEKAAKAEKEVAENALKAALGTADGVAGVCTWKRCKDSTELVTDWRAIAEVARIPPELIAAHTKKIVTKEGSRRLLLAKEK